MAATRRTTTFRITQDFLAHLLAVRRPTVTLTMSEWEKRTRVDGTRGKMRMLDRPSLEAIAYACYQKVKARL